MSQNDEKKDSSSFERMLNWNGELPQAVDTFVQTLIQEQAARHPESQAVCSWDGSLSYSELDNLSSHLANYLHAQGIGPETIVPLCFEKSIWTIVGLLAVLKAGGAFLLLDPSQPIARLQSIVSQTGAQFALSSVTCFDICKMLVDRVSVVHAGTFLQLEKEECSPSDLADLRLSNAAYYIFTSGSTGTPKGVIIEHSQLATTSTYVGECLGYKSRPRVFQFASYAFDACITDIFATLAHGGTICIPSDWERNNAIVDAMRRMEVTSAKFTPSLASNLVIENVPTLTTLVLGGESAPASLVEKWSTKLRLILVYGPTECCVICFISDVNQRKTTPGELGQPVGSRAWIVKQDNHDQLAEIDEIGELLIEGPLVGRGYLNDQAKTDRQFIRGPAWVQRSGSQKYCRMYRTGDLARHLADGTVCYAGRIDNQVKIRGQRLELEEVEKKLRDCLTKVGVEIRHIIVDAVIFSGLTSKQLVAFMSIDTPEPVGDFDWDTDHKDGPFFRTSSLEQERFLELITKVEVTMKLILPAYAIPSVWIPLQQVPFTVSRKTDRKRLRSIVTPLSVKQLAIFSSKPKMPSSTNGKNGKMTGTESKLLELWTRIFDVPPLSIELDDNFFSLGGDSVLAIKLIASARASGLDLSLDIIFEHPILCEMAKMMKNHTIREEDLADIPPFSLLNDTWNTSLVVKEASKECHVPEHFIEDIYPCSSVQEGLLALSMKDPGTYILQFVYQMPDSVNLERLKSAWESVSKRTQVLRTRFFDYSSELLQVVVKGSLKWDVVRDELATFLITEKARKLKFGEEMSRQTVLLDSRSRQYFLIWTVHHALVDGWSESDIISWVEQEYAGQSSSASIPKYNTFIRYIAQQDKTSAQEFWKQQLAEAPAPVFPRIPDPSYVPKVERSNRILHHLDSHEDAELEHKISCFKRGPATAATMIQAAWFLLVGMYSNSLDVVTGVTLNGRTAPLPGIDRIPGPTISTVPFRAQFTRDQKVSDFLRTIQSQYLGILPHAQFGLQNIRSLSEGAIAACNFRSLLVVQSANRPPESKKLLVGRSYSFPVMDFAIVMECEILKEGIDFRATFDHQVLSETQVRRMLQQMEDLLQRISLSGPDTKVFELQKISVADMKQVLQWNTIGGHPLKSTGLYMHELFEQRAHQHGASVAISAWNGEMIYGTLDQYSSRLAAHLQTIYRIGPESLVGIYFTRSLWAVVAMLAVLKSGGACVPMDPTNSIEQLQITIGRLGEGFSNLLLTSSSHTVRLEELGIRVLAVGKSTIDGLAKAESVSSKGELTNTAIVMFKPRGREDTKSVAFDHQAVTSGILSMGYLIPLSETSRVLQYAPYTDHVTIWNLLSTLVHGGCICIPSDEDITSDLSRTINSLQANHLMLTPTLASCFRPEELPNVKVLVIVGEPMTKKVIETWADHISLINIYSVAECAGYCTAKKGIQKKDHYSNIGRTTQATTWIIDPEDFNSLTPIGGVGEILIEGHMLIQGYLVNEGLKKSAFIEYTDWSRFNGSRGGRRFFRTGDLASYNADGSLKFVGRIKDQIKLQGQNVDVAEVEQRLREVITPSAGIAVSLALLRDGKEQLAAFLVVNSDKELNSSKSALVDGQEALGRFRDMMQGVETKLQSLLPHHMIPSIFIPISKFPLTASGKLDRETLQHLASKYSFKELLNLRGHNSNTKMSQPPTTGLEKRLYNLWKILLESEDFGIDDNFFQLGGGSVQAMRLVSMARREGLTMTVGGVFKTPTLRELALTVRENVSTEELAPFDLLRDLNVADLKHQAALQCGVSPKEIEDAYPLSTMQMHYITGYPESKKDISGPWDWQSQVVYSLPTSMDLNRFKQIWISAIRRHQTLRTRLVNTSFGIFQVVLREPDPFEWNKATDLEQYLREDRASHMRFGSRLVRLAIIQSEDSSSPLFVMSIHHTTYDGFARNILFKELENAYLQDPLSEAPLPKMNHFIKYISQADKAAATDFWTSYLARAVTKPLLTIPEGSPLPLNIKEKKISTNIPRLQGLGYEGITLPTIIEIAIGLTLANHLYSPDVILYSDVSGRNLPVDGLPDLIGPTTLFLPVRIHLSPTQPLSALLSEHQASKTQSLPYEYLGFLELREMPHLKDMLKNSLNMNINPNPLKRIGRGWGLEYMQDWASCDDPFGVNVDLDEETGEMEWAIYWDERFVGEDVVEKLLEGIVRVFGRAVEGLGSGREGVTVGEVLELEGIV